IELEESTGTYAVYETGRLEGEEAMNRVVRSSRSFVALHTATSLALALMVSTLNVSAFTQAPRASHQQEQRPSTKGAEIKGRSPVSKDVMKVKLPKPYETRLANGLQVMVLEDHKLPTFSMQMVILSGGMANADSDLGVAQYTASLLREGTRT